MHLRLSAIILPLFLFLINKSRHINAFMLLCILVTNTMRDYTICTYKYITCVYEFLKNIINYAMPVTLWVCKKK